MKRFFAGLLKFLAVVAVIGAVAYAAIKYWDIIAELVGRIKALCLDKCPCRKEKDDYADWEACE